MSPQLGTPMKKDGFFGVRVVERAKDLLPPGQKIVAPVAAATAVAASQPSTPKPRRRRASKKVKGTADLFDQQLPSAKTAAPKAAVPPKPKNSANSTRDPQEYCGPTFDVPIGG
jgi:hypothetical protein